MSTYPQHGTIRRDKVRLQVKKGYFPTDASKKGKRAPVADGVEIKSGQVVFLDPATEKFRLAVPADLAAGGQVYFAEKDSADFDITASGVMEGYPSSDDFVMQTAYIDTPGSPLTIGTLLTVSDANDGSLKVAAPADIVVARVSATGAETTGLINLKGIDSTAVDAGLLVVEFETGDRNTVAPA